MNGYLYGEWRQWEWDNHHLDLQRIGSCGDPLYQILSLSQVISLHNCSFLLFFMNICFVCNTHSFYICTLFIESLLFSSPAFVINSFVQWHILRRTLALFWSSFHYNDNFIFIHSFFSFVQSYLSIADVIKAFLNVFLSKFPFIFCLLYLQLTVSIYFSFKPMSITSLSYCYFGVALVPFNFRNFSLLITRRWSLPQSALVYALLCKNTFLNLLLIVIQLVCFFVSPSEFLHVHIRLRRP